MQKGTPHSPLRLHCPNTYNHVFLRSHGCEYHIIDAQNTFFPTNSCTNKMCFPKMFPKVSSIHKKGVVCSMHANINIFWQFSALSHHSQRTNLYMYLLEQYNRQNNSIASSQRFSVHFLSNYILSGPIFYSLPFYILQALPNLFQILRVTGLLCIGYCQYQRCYYCNKRRPELSVD